MEQVIDTPAGITVDPPASAVMAVEPLLRAEHIVSALEKGLVLLGKDLRVTWANDHFLKWCDESPLGKTFFDSIGRLEAVPATANPLDAALRGTTVHFRVQHRLNHHLDVTVSPIVLDGRVVELVACCDDVTSSVVKQQKLDALHRAGQELAVFDPDQLSEMNVDCRVDLLKQNIRRHTHNLLHYDVIEIRLLDRASGKLEPLLEEGMTREAANRVLYASIQGNGVTGYVAATGNSYLCHDTQNDPYFIQGSPDARSSMTVPLIFQDQVIGTLNVESPKPGAFGPEELQFAELFSRELAQTLYTLNLLSAQESSTAVQAIDAVNREIALPADELLAVASKLLDKAKEIEPEWVEPLKRVIADTRAIKERIQGVGDTFAPRAKVSTKRMKGMRILVVDSDERVRRSAHAMLEKLGCQVETASTAAEGIALARSGFFDGILTDIRHPDMGGYAAFAALKAAQPQAQIALTAAFGYDASHTIVKARQDGLKHVLFKPFRVEQLLKALAPETTSRP